MPLPRPVLATAVILMLPALVGCGGDDAPDAYGNFEATEITVSAESSGRIVDFRARTGMRIAAGEQVGQIDTTTTSLQRLEMLSRRSAARARVDEADAQINVLLVQLETAKEEYDRFRRLLEDEAATPRQANLQLGEVRALQQRIEAARTGSAAVSEETSAISDQLSQIEQRILDSRIENPSDGTVLATYARSGEFVQPGQPLYAIAALDTLTLRAYVTGVQLSSVRIGEPVTVWFDVDDDALGSRTGIVKSVADEAEFTPTPIQTRDERAEFVYAVEIDVANPDGALKIGMPAEVTFSNHEASSGDASASSVAAPAGDGLASSAAAPAGEGLDSSSGAASRAASASHTGSPGNDTAELAGSEAE